MICRALGYTAQAKELVGAWPANYIALGQQLNLYDDVQAVATVDRASAAQIVYNSLTCNLRYIDADGVTQNVLDAKNRAVTMLSSLGGEETYGGEGYVLDDTAASTALINVNEYVGQFVKTFNNSDDKIIAIEVLSTTVSGKYKAGDNLLSTSDVDYYFKTTDANYKNYATTNGATTLPTGFVNGVLTTDAAIAAGYFVNNTSYKMAVKISGKTITEVYSVFDWNRAAIDQFEDGDLNIEKAKINVNGTDYTFKTDKNGDIDYASFALLGVTSLDKIAEDNVIEVYTEGATTRITRLAVGTQTVTGDVTKATKDEDNFTIAGEKYDLATGGEKPSVGDTGTAYLNFDGEIAFWSADDSTSGNYAVFLGARTDGGTTVASGVTKVGLVLKDGTVKEYDLTSSSKFVNEVNGQTLMTFTTPALVTYSFDSNGKVSKIKTLTDSAIGGKTNEGKTRIGDTKYANSVVVFLKDGSDWEIGDVKNFDTKYVFNGTYAANEYIYKNGDDKIAAIIVGKDEILGSEKSYGVINTISRMSDDGTAKWYVNGFVDGKELAAFTDETADTAYSEIDAVSGVGHVGLYEITVDATGVVKAIDVCSTYTTHAGVGSLTVNSVDKANREITVSGGSVYGLVEKAVVYYYDDDEEEYVLSSIDKIGKGKKIDLISTDADDLADNLYHIVIFWDAE